MEAGTKRTQGRQHGSRGPNPGTARRGQAPPAIGEHGKKKSGFPTGMILMAALGLLFVCYLTNAGDVQTGIDTFFSAQVHSAHQHDGQVGTWFMLLLPYVAMAAVVAVLYVLLASLGVGKPKRKPTLLTEQLTIHQFAELAGAAGVGASVAREMYRMLLPDYQAQMRSTLRRSFVELDTPAETVWSMFELLVERSGGIVRGGPGIEALSTPTAMMQAAQQCVERAALEHRARLQQTAIPAQERHRTIVPMPSR